MKITEIAARWICETCALARAKPETRIPSGWKKRGESLYCPSCWSKQYILRAITLPVASPLDCDWKQLDAALKNMWGMTTEMSNWVVTQLFARDSAIGMRSSLTKMPPMERVYLYPELRARWPEMPSQSVASLEHSIQKKYRALRFDTLWTCKRSLPSFRYPVPFPIPAQGWNVVIEKQVPILSVRIGGQRLRLRLKGGFGYHRQREAVEKMASGEAVTGEMAILRDSERILVKLVAWLPRQPGRILSGTLRVRTDKESLLVALNEKDEKLWVYNADQIRMWQGEHAHRLSRFAEDQKYEQRPVPAFEQRRSTFAAKYRRYMDTACHKIAAQIAGYAGRRRFSQVAYDDSEKGYALEFPYFRLRQLIAEKLDAIGVDFVSASAPVVDESQEPLAGK